MALDRAQTTRSAGIWHALVAHVGADGSGTHPHARLLASGTAQPRDLADAAHLICSLHGRHPGVLDHAAMHRGIDAATGWLDASAHGFADERAQIVRLAVAAGPLPSTPGQAESETTVTGQRHALDMLALSDRDGCSLGAALALMLDWPAIRAVLDAAGTRFGVEMTASDFPDDADTETLVAAITGGAAIDRAIMFGAQQLIAQHRGLFDLLDARAEARNCT